MKIVVDGDACPVKDLIIDLANTGNYQVLIITSIAHWSDKSNDCKGELVEYITVDNAPEAVDMKIVNLVVEGDIVVTQDYGLAALLLGKGVKVISPRGKSFTEKNIDYLLDRRHRSAKSRRGGKKTGGPSKYSEVDKRRFERVFKKIIGLL